jgi:ribosomal protein S18 acetylase RimI-like enzyme
MATRGVFRRLWRREHAGMRDHLLRLDDRDRTLRFGGHVSDAYIADYCERLDWSRAVVLGYVIGGKLRGLGQLQLVGDGWPREAELAVSVERRYQSRGVGSELLRRLVIAARNRLIRRLHMVCLMDNARALRLARRLDGVVSLRNGEAEARLEPPWPTWWTWLEETLAAALVPGAPLRLPLG